MVLKVNAGYFCSWMFLGSLIVRVVSPISGGLVQSAKNLGGCTVSNSMGLKSRNMITLPPDVPDVEVTGVQMNERGDYIITVESTQGSSICEHCGRRITKSNGHGREIELRHLPILGRRVYVRLRPKRYECPTVRAGRPHKSWIGTRPRAHTPKRMTAI